MVAAPAAGRGGLRSPALKSRPLPRDNTTGTFPEILRFLKIIDTAGGEFLYFPKRSTLERDLRRQAILREFDGTNLRQLARKYGLSERHVRSILQKEGPHKTS